MGIVNWVRPNLSTFPFDCGNVSGLGANTSAFADYIILPQGGSVTFLDNSGSVPQTFTASPGAGNTLVNPGGIRKILSATNGPIIVGTGQPSGAGEAPAVKAIVPAHIGPLGTWIPAQ